MPMKSGGQHDRQPAQGLGTPRALRELTLVNDEGRRAPDDRGDRRPSGWRPAKLTMSAFRNPQSEKILLEPAQRKALGGHVRLGPAVERVQRRDGERRVQEDHEQQ